MSTLILSFRPNDVPQMADRLHAMLGQQVGLFKIAKGVSSVIDPGENYLEVIQSAVDKCEALIVVIGPQWLAGNWAGDGDDYDTLALTRALQNNKKVIPVLVNGAGLPADLPPSFEAMKRRVGIPIADGTFNEDAAKLVTAIQKVVTGSVPPPNGDFSPPPKPTQAGYAQLNPNSKAHQLFGGVIGLLSVVMLIMFVAVPWLSFDRDAMSSNIRDVLEESELVSRQAREEGIPKSQMIDEAMEEMTLEDLAGCNLTGLQLVTQDEGNDKCAELQELGSDDSDVDEPTLINGLEYGVVIVPLLAVGVLFFGVRLFMTSAAFRGAVFRNILILGVILLIFPFIWGVLYTQPTRSYIEDLLLEDSDYDNIEDAPRETRETLEYFSDLLISVYESAYPGIEFAMVPILIIVAAIGGLAVLGVQSPVQ